MCLILPENKEKWNIGILLKSVKIYTKLVDHQDWNTLSQLRVVEKSCTHPGTGREGGIYRESGVTDRLDRPHQRKQNKKIREGWG